MATATLYAPQIATAQRLIAARGAPVTFSRGAGSVYDPATDTYTGGTATTATGSAVQVRGDVDRFAHAR
jgi:hypothetical protein